MEHHDVLIAGGGIAGLTAAARLAADGRTVALADPAPAPNACPPDLRTTALLQPALETLRTAGIWPGLERIGAPLRVMRLVDAGGREQKPRETADFTGAPAGADLFGWNLPNQPLKDALWSHLQAQPSVTLLPGTKVTDYTARMDRAFARLSDGSQRTADLIVAADGRDSTLRDAAGIAKRRWGYGQKALVFAVTHPNPHDGVSTEIHRTGGPLTLVPLPDHEGRPASSIVWMMRGAEADAMAALDDSALALELTARTMGLYGPLEIASKRALWPIISQAALQLTARRLVLVAEAAHVMPPIGAQGLNTSLHDVEQLARIIEGAADPGAPALLSRYQARVLPRTLTRIAGVDVLNRAALARAQPLRDLRVAGLRAISRITPIRNLAVRMGLGV